MLAQENKTNKGRLRLGMPHPDFILLIYTGSHNLLHGFHVYFLLDHNAQTRVCRLVSGQPYEQLWRKRNFLMRDDDCA